MKKYFIMVISLMLIVGLLSYRKENQADYTIHEAYEYQILPGTEKWYALGSLDNKIKACAIPLETIQQMDTKSLVESVINYPLLGNMHFFNQ